MLHRALLASLLLALPLAAPATPVSVDIFGDEEASAAEGGTFSTTGGGCTSAGDRSSCGGGYAAGISGSLAADLDGDLLSGLSGDIVIDGIGTLSVLDGMIDFSGGLGSYLTTDYGTFTFGNHGWSGGGDFWAWGGNWQHHCNGWLGCKRFWLRFRGRIKPDPGTAIPEPHAALLFGLGAVAVSQRVRGRR